MYVHKSSAKVIYVSSCINNSTVAVDLATGISRVNAGIYEHRMQHRK